MIKNLKLATIWAVIYWVLIFMVVTVLMFALPNLTGTNQKIALLFIEPFLVLFAGYMYFRENPGELKDGVVLGIYFLIVGTILDAVITVPLFVKEWTFFTEWSLWAGYAETIVFAALAAQVFSKKEINPRV